jgi:squalene cyclase
LNAQPATVDDRAMLLTALRRSEAAPARVQAAAQALLKLQGIDGGWAGNKYLESDAWATSEALTALYEAGAISSKDAAYRRGLQFLVETRQKDGSWRVRSRAPKFQPYFESGFPYGHDQWISAAATARAVAVLARYAQ